MIEQVNTAPSLGGIDSANAALGAQLLEQNAQIASTIDTTRNNQDRRAAALEAFKQEMERAKQEQADAGFWDSVGSIAKQVGVVAGVVAGVAGAAFTGGSSLILAAAVAGAALSVASPYMDDLGADVHLGDLEIMGAKLGVDLSDIMALAGVALTCGAGLAAQGSAAAASGLGSAVQAGATAVAAGGAGTAGYAAIAEGRAASCALDHEATARASASTADTIERQNEALIDTLAVLASTEARTAEALGRMLEGRDSALRAAGGLA